VMDEMMEEDPGVPVVDDMDHLKGRAYAIVNLKEKSYVRAWKELPNNVVFLSRNKAIKVPGTKDGHNILDFTGNLEDSPDCIIDGIPFPLSGDQPFSFIGIVFMPDGNTVMKPGGGSGTCYYWIIVSEGYRDPIDGAIKPKANKRSFGLRVSLSGSVKFKEFP
jgi:hypothetical protein